MPAVGLLIYVFVVKGNSNKLNLKIPNYEYCKKMDLSIYVLLTICN